MIKKINILVTVLLVLSYNVIAQNQTVETYAGTIDSSGYAGDEGDALDAKLDTPYGIACDSQGNLYIADQGNKCIRKVDKNTGIITTIINSQTFQNPPLPFISSFTPSYIKIYNDALYFIVSDGVSDDYHIFKYDVYDVDANNDLSVYQSFNSNKYYKDFAIKEDSIFLSYVDGSTNGIELLLYGTLSDFSSSSTQFNYTYDNITSIEIDNYGDLLILTANSYTLSGKLLKIELTNWLNLSVVTLNSTFSFPEGMTLDEQGNIYVSDRGDYKIKKLNSTDSQIIVDYGTGTQEYVDGVLPNIQFYEPTKLAYNEGVLYITETSKHTVRRLIINKIPNVNTAFSPNGDNINDVWIIDGIEDYNENIVYIYNRWGDLIQEIENYDNVNNVWDGAIRESNNKLPGTYFYIIENNNKRITSGWVQVVK